MVFFLVVSSSRKNDLICDRDLLEGDEAGRVGGADTGAAVANGAVCDGELTKVVTDHLGLDLDLVELGAVVDTDDRADHLGDDDHLAQVRLDGLGLLTDHTLALGLPELLQQGPGGALLEESTLDRPAGLGSEQLDELVLGKVQELLQVNTTVGELLKHTTARLRLLTEKKESVEQRWRPAGQREGERGEKEGGTEWKCVWNVCGKRTKYIFPFGLDVFSVRNVFWIGHAYSSKESAQTTQVYITREGRERWRRWRCAEVGGEGVGGMGRVELHKDQSQIKN